MTRPLILVTNDDGIASPGLWASARAADALGEVWVVAPARQWTGAGRCMLAGLSGTATRVPPSAERPWPAYQVDATPAQTVQIALLQLLPRQPALVISGINAGENVGIGITISGTVGAALEAAAFEIPALAASLEADAEHHTAHEPRLDFRVAAHFVSLFAREILTRQGLPPGVDVLKIDVPHDATPATPWRVVRLSRKRYYRAVPVPNGLPAYARRDNPEDVFEPDSDAYTLQVLREVPVVPLSADLTAYGALDTVRAWFQAGRSTPANLVQESKA
ncbi:MAG: 5'/3'-nucleotidase SurE [Chloroflexi bacterium]|nr:5'/3'-nucleotidase SurE [Chloroflexota bacterium]